MEVWWRAMALVDDAEARGDAEGALEVMEAFSEGPDGRPFWRPWRRHYLSQFARLGPLLPRWAHSRWILAQATQSLDHGLRPLAMSALSTAVDVRGGLPAARDLVDAQARVSDHDWVYRQLVLYELGGLELFARGRISSGLLALADDLTAWTQARMEAHRLVERLPSHVTWERLRDGAVVRTPNTGAAARVWTDVAVLGRLVPSANTFVFESAPLAVPDPVAERVASDPADWLEALRQWDGYPDAVPLDRPTEHDGLLIDLPRIVWQNAVCDQPDTRVLRHVTPSALATSTVDLGRFLLDEFVAPDFCHLDIWACVAAALVEPDVVDELARSTSSDRRTLARLSDSLADPAASVCRLLAAGEAPPTT